MKYFYLIFIFIFLVFASCSEDDNTTNNSQYQSEGIIIGFDYRKCMCCWGWDIEINGIEYKFEKLPDNSNLDLYQETMPIEVTLDWSKDNSACNNMILVKRIKKK